MYWLDILIIVIMVFGFGSGLWRGLVREIVSFISVLTATFLATHYCAWGSRHLVGVLKNERLASLVGFCLIFLGIIAAGILIGRIIKSFLKKTGLSTTDKLLGALFGLLEAIVMIAVLFMVFKNFVPDGDEILAKSKGAPFFQPIAHVLENFLPQTFLDEFVNDVKGGVDKIKALPGEIKEKGEELKEKYQPKIEKAIPTVLKDKPLTKENNKALEEDKAKIGKVIKKSMKKSK